MLKRLAARVLIGSPIATWFARDRSDPALDPQIAALLALSRLQGLPPIESMDAPTARRFAQDNLAPMEVAHVAMRRVIDTTVPGRAGRLPVRIYVPPDAGRDWIVYFHGGGGVIGSIHSYDRLCRLLAAQTRCTVASVEYRLGPEAKHPAAIEDACDAWDALLDRVPAGGKAVVAGDSFGGFLAAHVDRQAATGRRPALQVLIYPGMDWNFTAPSITRFAEGYLLTRAMMTWFRERYYHPEDDRSAASPAGWASVAEASPALVVTAGFDPLVDDGDAYARKLAADGVAVRHRRHASLVHGYLNLAGVVDAARRALDQTCADITELLAAPLALS